MILRRSIVSSKEIFLGHSPDADDAFMFYGLAREKIVTGPYKIIHILQDIQTLNERAVRGEFDITAVSIHAYSYIKRNYLLTPCGTSMGENYGPIVVSKYKMSIAELPDKTIAVPGTMTSAFLALRLAIGDFDYCEEPFDKILPQVKSGEADAGLIIHEGQITYDSLNLYNIVDLGRWWFSQTGLPLPLGGNAIKRSLGSTVISDLCKIVHESISYSLDHFDEALDYAMNFAHGIDREEVETFVRMYVNKWTIDIGEIGRKAIMTFLSMAEHRKMIPPTVPVDFAPGFK